jgi:hypothetical protein
MLLLPRPSLQGELFRLPQGACTVRDRAGRDGCLDLKSYPPAPKPRPCLSPCAVAEHGQSGQPAWSEQGPGNYVIRAVLSRGPEAGTCGEHDTYTQLDLVHFDLLKKVRGWRGGWDHEGLMKREHRKPGALGQGGCGCALQSETPMLPRADETNTG